jgi:hypothetical protein
MSREVLTVERLAILEMRRRARMLVRMADYLPPEIIAGEVASKLAGEIAAMLDDVERRCAIAQGEEFLIVR